MFEFTSRSETDTDRLGTMIAAAAQGGEVISLEGPLGAGKTRLVQAIAKGVGADRDQVTSPTFVILNEYRSGRLPLFHFDLYRLKDDDEFWGLGPEEYFADRGISLLEWGNRFAASLPPRANRLTIEVVSDNERLFRVEGELGERLSQEEPKSR